MITALAIFVVIGVSIGLWGEFSEQRRLSDMARQYRERRQ